MFRYYANTLRQLHGKLHQLKASPYSNNSLLLEIQYELIKKIKYVEGVWQRFLPMLCRA